MIYLSLSRLPQFISVIITTPQRRSVDATAYNNQINNNRLCFQALHLCIKKSPATRQAGAWGVGGCEGIGPTLF